ncbi:MAG TPA: hypothetical protein VFV38_19235 [Ktedonobacteraceae bacterium]|nr:hypothetical protein [Ktedonobacteraceae bacterium]
MAFSEERLSQVEFNLNLFKTETVKAYGDMAVELTLVKGLAIKAIEQLVGVQTTLNEHTKRLDTIDTRLDRMENMLVQVLARLPEKS